MDRRKCLYVAGCFHHPSWQRIWIRAAGLALIIGPLLVFVALLLQDLDDSPWSLVLGIASTSEMQPPSTSSSDVVPESLEIDSPCFSRIQHMNYRPASQIISQSTAWEKAFRDYEQSHTKCSQGRNWTLEFFQESSGFIRSDSSKNSSFRSESCLVLIYTEGSPGLGNRLLSLVSAFLYSLLTKRVFLMDSRGHLAKLLCEPFRDSSWLLPSNFPFEALDEAISLGEFEAGAKLAESSNSTAQIVSLHLDHSQNEGDQLFFCSETRKRLESVQWLAWNSNQYYVPRFFTFPELWQQLIFLFPNISLTFTHLSRSVLLPANPVWLKIRRIYSSYLSQADELLGIQIRRHSVPNSGEYDDAAFRRILHCLISNKFLPNTELRHSIVGTRTEESQTNRRLSRTRSRHYPPRVNYAVLVTSLQLRFFEELRDLYTSKATVDASLIRMHMVSHEGMEWHSFDQAEKAFIEMWLLSLSDRISTSTWSTFGYVAQGLGAMRPLVVELRGEIYDESHVHNSDEVMSTAPSCYFGQSIEPCNHFTYYHPTAGSQLQCARNMNETYPSVDPHLAWIRNNIRPCQDFPQGFQLVV